MVRPSQASLTAEQILHGWIPRRVGRVVWVFDEVESTNTLALDAVDSPDADGLVILADAQSQGRGRLGRTWYSPRGASVLCSVILVGRSVLVENPADRDSCWSKADAHARMSAFLTHVTAVAACDAIRQSTDITPAIKWPNDLRHGGRKLGGILIESRALTNGRQAWVVGIGINCLQHRGHFPRELRETATSLELAASHAIDRLVVIRSLLQSLDEWQLAWNHDDMSRVHSAWLDYAEPLGQKIRLRREGQEYAGWTVEIDPVGGLLVRLESGQIEWFDPMLTSVL